MRYRAPRPREKLRERAATLVVSPYYSKDYRAVVGARLCAAAQTTAERQAAALPIELNASSVASPPDGLTSAR